MFAHDYKSAQRPEPDQLLVDIADYALGYQVDSAVALETARLCLMDSLACMFQALDHPACTKLLGPIVPGAELAGGARVPGCSWELDPVTAAFNIGALVRWLDFNDTWLAAEWGHPSDNLGAILAVADYVSRRDAAVQQPPLTVSDVLSAMVKAHEIQGVLALENSFNRVGLDHVLLVRIASTAVAAALVGADRASKPSMPFPTPGSTAAPCARIATPPTPARAKAGPPATPPAAASAMPSWPSPAKWAIPRRSPPPSGDSATCSSRASPSSSPARWAAM